MAKKSARKKKVKPVAAKEETTPVVAKEEIKPVVAKEEKPVVKKQSGLLLGFLCFLIVFGISGLGWGIQQNLRIGFTVFGMPNITFVPLALSLALAIWLTNRYKARGEFNRDKFWLGFFLPIIIAFIAFGACLIIIGASGGF
jgi:hypothetical protein